MCLTRVHIDLHDPKGREPLIPHLLLELLWVDPPCGRTARPANRAEGLLAVQVSAALVQLHPVS